jgi:outer membrane protein assembly factor BamE (lipoprotein component of BamABCDE complex)
MRYVAILLILLLGLTFSCATITQGKPIDRAKMNQLMAGQTKVEKVVEVFGQPDKVERLATGEEKYTYRYYQEIPRILRKNEITKQQLDVIVGDGVVKKYDLAEEGVRPVSEEAKQSK